MELYLQLITTQTDELYFPAVLSPTETLFLLRQPTSVADILPVPGVQLLAYAQTRVVQSHRGIT
jgi:hypothetical protein